MNDDIRTYAPREQVNNWLVVWYDGTGATNTARIYGKLVLQEHHTLIMNPETKAILFSVANCNAGPVEPA